MLSRVVSKLQSMELIDRTPDPDDGRSAWVAATDRGSALDAQVKAERAAVVSQCLDQLTGEQAAALAAAIPALEDLARAMWRSAHGELVQPGEPAGPGRASRPG
jgi:DNA-binding MarR family transcriptional regulator